MERPVDLPDRLVELLEHAVRASDPEVALHALSALRRELDAFERVQAWRALDAGSSYGAVARALGISRQAAHRRYRDLAAATEPPPGAARARAAARRARGPRRRPARGRGGGRARRRADGLRAPAARHPARRRPGRRRRAARRRRHARERPHGRPADAGRRGATPDERASRVTAYARRVFTEALREAAARPRHVIGVADLLRVGAAATRAAARAGRWRRWASTRRRSGRLCSGC